MGDFKFVSLALHVGSRGHRRAFLGVDPGDDPAQVVADGFPIDAQQLTNYQQRTESVSSVRGKKPSRTSVRGLGCELHVSEQSSDLIARVCPIPGGAGNVLVCGQILFFGEGIAGDSIPLSESHYHAERPPVDGCGSGRIQPTEPGHQSALAGIQHHQPGGRSVDHPCATRRPPFSLK